MYHWIRDCKIDRRGSTNDNGAYLETLFGLYHFLRLAGWKNIWEIDGYSNHCPDGSTEEDGVADWTALGASPATLSKDTAIVHMGQQSLKITTGTGTDEGVQSSDFTDIQTGGLAYKLRLRVYNDTGRTWELQWTNDDGINWSAAEDIVDNSGVWTEVLIDFTSHGSTASGHAFRIIDANNPGSSASLYVDSIVVYRSFFEDLVEESGTDGAISSNDQFDSTAYSFVNNPAPVGDIGKYVAIWDDTNLGNSGLYKIESVSGGTATLDLRAGGTPALTDATGLSWRMIDIENTAPYQYDPGLEYYHYCGFGLESPHATKWRLFFRSNWNTSGDWTVPQLWASPYDADFDVMEGNFYPYEPGTHNYASLYQKGELNGRYGLIGRDCNSRSNSAVRLYAMVDDEGSFLSELFRDFDSDSQDICAGGVVGFTGSDANHTLRESFCCFHATSNDSYIDDISFNNSSGAFSINGCQCTGVGPGWMTRACIMVLGRNDTTDELDISGPTYQANPFDGNYWKRKPKIARDYFGTMTTNPSEKDMTGPGCWHSSSSPDKWTTIDSNNYLHIHQGFYWEWWNGHTPLV